MGRLRAVRRCGGRRQPAVNPDGERLIQIIDRIVEAAGRTCAWLTLLMGLITFAIVLIRYGFDSGDVAVQESVVYLHAVAFMLGIAYTFKHDEHVRVDVVYSRLTTESRAWVNVSGHVLFLLPCTLTIGWYSISYAGASWRILEGSMEAGGIPALFLLKSLIPAMAVTLLAQGISETVKSVRIILDDGHGKRSK